MLTNFALNGNGFVAVRQRLDVGHGLPTFSRTNLYTRRGDFAVDRQGYLVNGAGNVSRRASRVDPATGQPTGTGLDVVQVAVNAIPPRASTTFTYRATVPSTPATTNYDPAVAGSDIWTAGAAGPALVTPASAPSVAVLRLELHLRRDRTVPTTRWARPWTWICAGRSWPTTAAGNTTWGLYFNVRRDERGGVLVDARLERDLQQRGCGDGACGTYPVDMSARGLGALTVDVAGGVGQYHLDSKQLDLAEFSQDGYSAGELDQVYVSSAGMVTGSFTNGRTQALAQVAIAQFNAPDMLERQSGSAFAETIQSGMPIINGAGANLISGALEGSNTDIAEEFSRMIVTQQAYSGQHPRDVHCAGHAEGRHERPALIASTDDAGGNPPAPCAGPGGVPWGNAAGQVLPRASPGMAESSGETS